MNKNLKKQFIKFVEMELFDGDNWEIKGGNLCHKYKPIKIHYSYYREIFKVTHIDVDGQSVYLKWWESLKFTRIYKQFRKRSNKEWTRQENKKTEAKIYKVLQLPTTTEEISEKYQIGSWKSD